MNWLVVHIVSGQSFFSGLLMIALAAVVVPVLGYATYYLSQVPQITQKADASDFGKL